MLRQLVILSVIHGECYSYHHTMSMVLIESMLQSQIICRAYMIKGNEPDSIVCSLIPLQIMKHTFTFSSF